MEGLLLADSVDELGNICLNSRTQKLNKSFPTGVTLRNLTMQAHEGFHLVNWGPDHTKVSCMGQACDCYNYFP